MMKKIMFLFIFVFVVSCGSKEEVSDDMVVMADDSDMMIDYDSMDIITEGLMTPESVNVYNNKMYVGNLGDPNLPGDGYIIEANLDGSSPKVLFKGMLDSPKGFDFISGNLMVIADQVNDGSMPGNIVLADISTGEILSKMEVADSKFLNDIVMIDNKTLALTDTGASKVYTISIDENNNMSLDEIASGVVGANGIYYDNGMLYVAGSTFGGDANGGNIYAMSVTGDNLEEMTDTVLGTGGLDGIAIDDNMLYVSDWGSGENMSVIYVIDLDDMSMQTITGEFTSLTDFDLVDGVIYTPEFSKNKVKKITLK